MKQVARIWGADIQGKVYQDGERYFYTYDATYRDKNGDERPRSGKSEMFDSLDKLIESLPHPRVFRRDGDSPIDSVELEAIHKRSRAISQGLSEKSPRG